MKLHQTLIQAVYDNITQIFRDQKFAPHSVIESCFKKNKQFGSRDRKFIAETTYNLVRHWILLNYLAETTQEPYDKENLNKILACYFIMVNSPFKNEFNQGLNEEDITNKLNAINDPRILYSFPEWIFDKGLAELGETWLSNLKELNTEAKAVLRINTIKTTKELVSQFLTAEGIDFIENKDCEDALILGTKKNITNSVPYQSGWFEMQDISSQKVSKLLDVQPGMNVIDACAGAGGKALHLAALMENKGNIIVYDPEKNKLTELKKRAFRAGITCIQAHDLADEKIVQKLIGKADRLLLDAPCTGIGVIKRNPHSKWKINQELYNQVTALQEMVLNNYSKFLKPGGIMVYATCSILPSENEQQINRFIAANNQFELMQSETLLPADTGFDGFYMAKIKRVL